MMTKNHLVDLLMRHLQGNLSDTGREQLNQWLSESERNRRIFESLNDEGQLRQLVLLYHQEEEENNEAIILSKIRQRMGSETQASPDRKMYRLPLWSRVAVLVLLVGSIAGYGYYLLNKNTKAPVAVAEEVPADIPPGRDGAILTLANGRQLVLDSLGNGVIASQSGTQVLLQNGLLAYDTAANAKAQVYNNLSTPKGRQFRMVLPDGTKVWLNVASSIHYPTFFAGNSREVAITGEVYFDVAKIEHLPFIIHVKPQARIQVLGTQFNVNAYSNEPVIKTTLVEGSLKISAGATAAGAPFALLQPGQQAQVSNAGNNAAGSQAVTILKNADVEKAVAWRSGLFNFEDASLEEVMRQVERWYDIEVVYEKNIPNIRFGGKMTNDVSLSGLLKSLEESEVHFRVEGRKLIVLP